MNLELSWGQRFCALVLLLLLPPVLAQGPRPKCEWTFEAARIEGDVLQPGRGKVSAEIAGALALEPGSFWEAASFTGSRDVSIHMDYELGGAALPSGALTVEAWVKLDTGGEWGGFIGAMQDNGGFEKGWLLGYHKSRFCFALSSEGANDGDGRLTYMTADQPFDTKQWHQVVGTYNGKSMRLYVDGVLAKESAVQTGKILYPKRAHYVLGAYRDDNEHYPINGLMRSAALWPKALSAAQIKRRYLGIRPPPVVFRDPFAGPIVRHHSDRSVAITWRTEKPEPTAIWTGIKGERPTRIAKSGKRREHEILLQSVERETEHAFHIDFAKTNNRTPDYYFDTTFDYPRKPLSSRSTTGADQVRDVAATLLEDTPTAGFALLVGSGDGEMALEMARTSSLMVVVAEPDAGKARRLQIRASQESLYGSKLSVHNCDLSGVQLPRWFANVIYFPDVPETEIEAVAVEDVHRCLRPDGGVVFLPATSKQLALWSTKLATRVGSKRDELQVGDGLKFWRIERPALKGSDSWTHQYANAAQTAASADELAAGEMQLLWYGPPGPRPMLDRGARSPAPVADNGRLFIQGDRILFGLDAFNGAVLWSAHFPGLRRVNMPRDASNMVAHGDELLIAESGVCRRLDAATGAVLADIKVPVKARTEPRNWGYLSAQDGSIYGSTTKKAATYTGASGQWYDGGGAEAFKVTSDSLFAVDANSGKVSWQYRRKSVIVNATIVMHRGSLYFLESRNSEALKNQSGRVGAAIETDAFLVALNAATGRQKWRQKIDIAQSERTLYLCAAEEELVLSMSKSGYSLRGFSAASGKKIWSTDFAWERNHHGGAMQHPVITDGVIYVERRGIDLKTGEIIRSDLPSRRGCGTMSGSKGALFYRAHSHGIWDIETSKHVEYEGLRSGCWLGMIPSEGLLLMPEASSGCSCSKDPIQISMALAPVERRGK